MQHLLDLLLKLQPKISNSALFIPRQDPHIEQGFPSKL